MRERVKTGMDRRSFLRAMGPAPAAVVATAIASSLVPTEAHAYDPGKKETHARYRESEHVKAFYRTNGYETRKK